MDEYEDNNNDKSKLRFENELKKIKLSLERDASFFSPFDAEPSLELESLWLDHILKFEEAFNHRKSIVLYEKIGRPEYRIVEDIPDNEMKNELERITEILFHHKIVVDTIYEVDDREIYRFITEDLFAEEVEDIPIKEMIGHIIYEEFYPNHECDIRNLCKEFIVDVLNKQSELYPDYISIANKMKIEGGDIDPHELIEKIEVFRQSFDSLKLDQFRILFLNITGIKAEVDFYIRYSVISKQSKDKKIYSGKGRFGFIYKYDFWFLSEMMIPGII